MKASEKVLWLIANRTLEYMGKEQLEYPCENIEELCEKLYDTDEWQDMQSEIRAGTVETDIEAPWSRHYETKSVASKLPDNTWVGWPYYYGGGKHGSPESIDFISDAYDLTVEEKEQVVIVQNFTKV